MAQRRIGILTGCLAGVLLVVGAGRAGESGRHAGFQLLRESQGARAAAMGNAFAAVTDDQTALSQNPASASTLMQKDFVVAHQNGIAGIQAVTAGWGTGNGRRGGGISLSVNTAGGIEARTGPSAAPAGIYHLYEMNASLTFAQTVWRTVRGGVSVHAVHEDLATDRASGFSVDAGLLAAPGPEGLTVGAALLHVGRTDALAAERIPLPRVFQAGASYQMGKGLASADVKLPAHGNRTAHAGMEFAPYPGLALRAGYTLGHDTRGLSLGLGVSRRNWRVDYAYVPQQMDLGAGHRIAIGIR